MNREPGTQQRVYQRGRKVFRGESASQQAGQRDGHLNGGEEFCRLFGQPSQFFRPGIALLGQLFELGVIHGNDGDLSAGKHRVNKYKNNLYYQCSNHNDISFS